MGRLRDGRENPLFQHYGSEIVELYGNDDVILFRFDESLSKPVADPLWDEYSPSPKYLGFKIKAFVTQFTRESPTASPHGKDTEFDAIFSISRTHLDQAGVPQDVDGRMIREGDVLAVNEKGDTFYFDIVSLDRKGYVNQSDQWVSVEANCKRREKFVAERKL